MEQDSAKAQEQLKEVEQSKTMLEQQRAELEKRLDDMNRKHEELMNKVQTEVAALPTKISHQVNAAHSAAQPGMITQVQQQVSASAGTGNAASKSDVDTLKLLLSQQNEMMKRMEDRMRQQEESYKDERETLKNDMLSLRSENHQLQTSLDTRWEAIEHSYIHHHQ